MESYLGYRYKLRDGNPDCLRVNNDEFIYYTCDSLIRYSISQHHAVEKFYYPDQDDCNYCFEKALISNSGKYIVSYVGCNLDIFLSKGSDFQQYSVHKLQGPDMGQFSNMAVSDEGTAIMINSNGGLNLYDLATSATLGYYPKNFTGDSYTPLKISPTGEYFFIPADTLRLVRFKNGKFTEVWKPNSNEILFYDFDSHNPNQLVTFNGSKLSLRLCADFSLVSEFDLKEDLLLNIDYLAGEILTYAPGHLYIRSLSDGLLIKDVPTNINPWIQADRCYLVNHTIVSGWGLLYFI